SLAQQQDFVQVNRQLAKDPSRLDGSVRAATRFWASYVPAGWYWWGPPGPDGRVRQPAVIDRAAATVIEKARQLDGTVAQEQIRQSPGDLFFSGDLAATPRSRATRWDLTRGGSWSSSDAPGAPKP